MQSEYLSCTIPVGPRQTIGWLHYIIADENCEVGGGGMTLCATFEFAWVTALPPTARGTVGVQFGKTATRCMCHPCL
jgi:hypothetical protein